MVNRPLHTAAAIAVVLVGGCTNGDGAGLADPDATAASTAATGPDTAAAASTEQETIAVTSPPPGGSSDAPPSEGVPVSTAAPEPVDVPEVGVPGLDSDDEFCAAWSRWAGTYQVLLVANAFGTGGPEALASMEVVAAPVLVEAAAAMVTVWPASIASERGVAADGLLGPITRRLTVARDALDAAGADDAMVDLIEAAWLAGLAERDPTTPEFGVDLPPEIWAVVDRAAADTAALVVPFADDPSLITDVETPLTEEYLAVSCPDQGTLSGQEIDPAATLD